MAERVGFEPEYTTSGNPSSNGQNQSSSGLHSQATHGHVTSSQQSNDDKSRTVADATDTLIRTPNEHTISIQKENVGSLGKLPTDLLRLAMLWEKLPESV